MSEWRDYTRAQAKANPQVKPIVIKAEFHNLLNQVLDEKVLTLDEVALICGTRKQNIQAWREENPAQWPETEVCEILIPKLQYVLENFKPKEEPKLATPPQKPTTISAAIQKAATTETSNVKEFISSKNAVPMQLVRIRPEDKNMETLKRLVHQRIEPLNQMSETRLEEYWNKLRITPGHEEDWFDWAFRGAVQVASKVTYGQRSVAYLIGIYKSWLAYGFGNSLSDETKRVLEVFRNRFNIAPSTLALQKIQEMVQKHGIARATEAILTIDKPQWVDFSAMVVDKCEEFIENHG